MLKKSLLVLAAFLIIAIVSFFAFVPTQLDGYLNPVSEHQPYSPSEQARRLHNQLFVGDWHADSLLWNRNLNQRHDYSHVDIPRLQAGNVGLQMFTTVTRSPRGLNYDENASDAPDNIKSLVLTQRWPIDTWTSLTARALHQARKLHTFAAQNSDLVIIKTKGDLANFVQNRKSKPKLVGGLLGTEGSHALDGKLHNVQNLFDAGFRMMSLQHFFDNKLGGSLHGQSQSGLTTFGREVVNEIARLSIILDVSHSSEAVVEDVLKIAKSPLVVSHTGFKGHCDTARNISDALMQKIAAQGGLIAVGYWKGAVCGETPRDVVKAMQYGLELVGEDHLSLGSDFDGTVRTAFDTSELVALTDEMLKASFTDSQIRKIMGGNMLKLLTQQLPD